MNKVFNYLKVLGYYFAILIVYLVIISIFYYFELLNYNVINIISYIFVLLLQSFVGIKISRIERKKGYLNGFTLGLLITVILSLITLITGSFTFKTLIYYVTLILSTMVGGIIGVPNEK